MKTKHGRIYGRFSSLPQERGDSKRRQIEGAKAYAEKNGITVTGTPYFDEGVSGKAEANLEKEFGRLLKEVKSGEIVLCEFLDRIGRQNPFLVGKLIYDLVQQDVTVIAWAEGKEINKENINELSTQFAVFTGSAVSHADNVRKMKRLRETNANALKQGVAGKQSGSLVKYLPQCFKWNFTENKIYLDETAADVIRRIYKLFNDGTGKTTICKILNSENVPTLYKTSVIGTKKPWMEVSIKNILKNESYAGVLNVKGNRITCIPKVVSHAEFDKAQLLLRRYSMRRGKTSGRVNNLFNGLAVCKSCGGTVNVNVCPPRKPGNKTVYMYRCKNARLGVCKDHKMLHADVVEYMFMTFCFMGDTSLVKADTTETLHRIQAAKNKVEKIKAAISNLYDLVENGDTDAKDRVTKRKLELAEAEGELTVLKGQSVEQAALPAAFETVRAEIIDGQKTKVWDNSKLLPKLQDNEIRLKIRANLPAIFEKVVFDPTDRTLEPVPKEGVKLHTFFKDTFKFIRLPRTLGLPPK